MLLVVAALWAVCDWVAVATKADRIETIAKPAVMVGLMTAVVVAGDGATRWLVVAGLALSLVGDVALLERVNQFVAGLGAFLFAHLFFVAAFVSASSSGSVNMVVLVAGVVLCVCLGSVGVAILKAASENDARLKLPVAAYEVVLTVMVVAASTGALLGALGAALFAISDTVLGWNKFVRELANGRLVTHMLYHLGQGLIAAWAILL